MIETHYTKHTVNDIKKQFIEKREREDKEIKQRSQKESCRLKIDQKGF